MKYATNLLFLFILLSFIGISCTQSPRLDSLCMDWEARYEFMSEYKDGILVKTDTSNYCWIFHGTPFVRLFQDSIYISYDTVHQKNQVIFEPREFGIFQLSKDSLIIGGYEMRVVSLTNDTIVLQRQHEFNDRLIKITTILINTENRSNSTKFEFTKNRIDTITTFGDKRILSLDGRPFDFVRYEKAFLYNRDTVLHLVKDIPAYQPCCKDSILKVLDEEFRSYYMGDYGNQREVCGHTYDTICYAFDKYITYYYESYEYSHGYIGAMHGDWSHAYKTFVPNDSGINHLDIFIEEFNGEKLRFNDVFNSGVKDEVNLLIADAVISHKIKTGWIDVSDKPYLRSKRIIYERLDYSNRIALGKDGLIISLIYGDPDTDICYAENYICVTVPYQKLKPYLRYPFSKLAR